MKQVPDLLQEPLEPVSLMWQISLMQSRAFSGMVQNLRDLVNNRREEASPDNVYAG